MRTVKRLALLLALTATIATASPAEVNRAMPMVVFRDMVTVTAYTPVEMKCKATNCITASGVPAKEGTAAISRDLEKRGVRFGDRLFLNGIGSFVVRDRMHKKWTKRIDIYMDSYDRAVRFGKKKTLMVAHR